MTKTTKRALLASVLSLILCVSLLIGSTFAWFTDKATTGVNKIVSGNLDIGLQMKDAEGNWVDAENQTLTFKTADNRAAADILWEPGCTYALPELRVVNKGNLAVKYEIFISGINGDAKLNEVIDWKINDNNLVEYAFSGKLGANTEGAPFTISGTMQTTAGNEYQGLTISGISIVVLATQDTVEKDSFTNEYDANANYYEVDEENKIITISTAEGMIAFAAAVNSGARAGNNFAGWKVRLNNDIDLAGFAWTPIGNMANKAYFSGEFDGQNHTISNLYVSANRGAGLFGELRGTVKNLTVDGATVVGNHWGGVIAAYATDNCGATITKCTVKNASVTLTAELVNGAWDNGDKAGAIMGYIAKSNPGITDCTVEKVTVSAYRDLGGIVGYADTTVTGCSVKELTAVINKTHNYKNYTTDAEHDCGNVVGEKASSAVVEKNTVNGVEEVEVLAAGTAADLEKLMNDALSNPQTGNIVIDLTNNIDVNNQWKEFSLKGYNGVSDITVNGNGFTISNLNKPLITGSFAGDGVITINDLTIENAVINETKYNDLGLGALVSYSDASGGVALNNCKLVDSKITCTDGYAGGLVGYVSSALTVSNCTVTDSVISGNKSAGAILGHGGANVTVSNCEVSDCTVSETLEGRTDAGAAAIAGRMSNGCTLTLKGTITLKNNTVNQGAAAGAAANEYCANATPVRE